MPLLLDVTYSDPDADLSCQCAVLELSHALCRRLRDVGEALLRCRPLLPELYKVVCWQQTVDFYGGDLVDDCDLFAPGWRSDFGRQGFALVPPAIDLQRYEPCDTECQQEIVRYDGPLPGAKPTASNSLTFHWVAIPEHGGLYIITREVSLPVIGQQLAKNVER